MAGTQISRKWDHGLERSQAAPLQTHTLMWEHQWPTVMGGVTVTRVMGGSVFAKGRQLVTSNEPWLSEHTFSPLGFPHLKFPTFKAGECLN